MKDSNLYQTRKAKGRPSTSLWVTTAIWLLLLLIFALTGVAGAFGLWLILFAGFVVLSALYSLLLGRRSWIGLPHRKAAGAAVGAGLAILVVGGIVTGATAQPDATLAEANAVTSMTASAAPTVTAPHENMLRTECATEGEKDKGADGVYVCTPEDSGQLVWMTEENSNTLLAERVSASQAAADAEATKAAQEKAAAEQAVAKKAADQAAAKKAADQTAANEAARVAAEQAAAEQAAADKAAAEQAAQQAPAQEAPAPQAPVAPAADAPGASAYYPNCAAARAAGAAPMYEGQPGYRAGLDRDKDGIACDK